MSYDITTFSANEVIIYLRKSRSDDPALTVEEVLFKHETQLQEYALTVFGDHIPEYNIFREVVSGETIAARPIMQQVMRLLETGTRRAALVIEPARLSRGDLEDCGRIINTFRYTNTLVITPPKTYDLTDEYDRKFFEMELMRSNDYLEYTKKILNRGRVASVKQGNFIGSVPAYGYKKVKTGSGKDASHTLEIVPEEAEAVKIMYHLFIHEGYGFTRIAKHLDSIGVKPRKSDHWSPAAIKDMIENPVYIGKIRWNHAKTQKIMVNGQITKTRPREKDMSKWVYVDGKHQPIIDEATYQAALDMKGKKPKVKRGTELSNPFAGLLFCGTCGKAMSHKVYHQNKCNTGHITEGMICNSQSICKTKSVSYAPFLDRVVKTLEDTIADFEVKLQNNDTLEANQIHMRVVNNLEADLQRLKAKDLRQKDAYEDGIYTKAEYALRNAKLQEQISKTVDALNQAKESILPVDDYEEKIMRFTNCLNALLDPTVPAKTKNILLKSCINKIIYHNNMESKPGVGRYVENIFSLDIFLRL